MADYNIYIHAIGTGSNNGGFNPTVPWSLREGGEGSSPTEAWSGSSSGSGSFLPLAGIGRTAAFLSNPDSIVGSAVSSAFKFLPIVAAAGIIIKTGLKIYENALDFSILEGGDYSQQVSYQNFRQTISNIFSPFNTTFNAFRQETAWRVENSKKTQQRALLGDSVINAYTNRGV